MLLGTSNSSSSGANLELNPEPEVVQAKKENDKTGSKSNQTEGSTAAEESNEDDMGDNDSVSGSDSEVLYENCTKHMYYILSKKNM